MSKDPGSQEARGVTKSSGLSPARLLPIVVLVAGAVSFFALDLDQYVTFEALREHHDALKQFVADNPIAAPLVYMAIYAVAVALSLPGGAILSITGGFLFGSIYGTTLVVVAATLGAIIIFLAAKTALGDMLRAKAGPWMQKMSDGFQENALSYMLFLRLIPLFPFFVVNLVPAFLGVGLGVYALGTFIGIIPGAFVFVTVGAGLGSIFASGEEFSVAGILTPEIITALVGLAVLSLLPILYKKYKARQNAP
ncbi:MAG: TVP38/TMEM64 family protein [Pseudomonadota bacterium]